MNDKPMGCPFCEHGEPYFEGGGNNWQDDRRYVQMKLYCCVTMSSAIGWHIARELSPERREQIMRESLIERWNHRPARDK